MNQDFVRNLVICLPPLYEQQAIAAYLDAKTAQIDRKIDLLTQKVEKYRQLKQSLINAAVTRGLDNSVPMKDSGIDWVRNIPVHWTVKRVKEIGNLVLGKMLDNVSGADRHHRNFLKSRNIGWLKVDVSDVDQMYFSPAEMRLCRLAKGDLLLSEGGEVGKTSQWEGELEECYIQNSVHKLTVFQTNHSRYFLYQSYLLGQTRYYDSIVNQVSIKHLTKEKLLRVLMVRPPMAEQQAIATYLDSKTAEIDRIVDTTNRQIDKLKELRTALINDVVTGKRRVT